MRYVLKYHLFEGRINPKVTIERQEIVNGLLRDSNSMDNIRKLFPDNDNLFHIDTAGNIVFGEILRISSPVTGTTINKNSPVGKCIIKYHSYNSWSIKNKQFNSLEEALKFVWANIVATQLSAFKNKNKMFDELYKGKYWNKKLSIWQILKKEVPNVIDSETTVSNELSNINNWLNEIGIHLNHWYNSKRHYYTCAIDGSKITNEVFKKLEVLADEYDSNFDYVGVNNSKNKVHNRIFPIKTKDVKDEVLKGLMKMNFIKTEGTDSKELLKFFKECYRYYIRIMFKYMGAENMPALTIETFYPIIVKTLPNIDYKYAGYLKKYPELLDMYRKTHKKITDTDFNNAVDMGSRGFGD